jgi:feruloyl esterase
MFKRSASLQLSIIFASFIEMAFFTFATRLALLTFFYHVNANPLIKPNQQTLQCATGTFSNVVVGTEVSIVIETATPVPANGSFAESALANKGFPGAFGLPKLCAVIVNVTNTSAVPQSNYRLGLFLPDTWNSKVLTVGGSSFAGGVSLNFLGGLLPLFVVSGSGFIKTSSIS